jgi:hypothetical protein
MVIPTLPYGREKKRDAKIADRRNAIPKIREGLY